MVEKLLAQNDNELNDVSFEENQEIDPDLKEFLEDIRKEDEVGPAMSQQLANVFQGMVEKPLKEEKLEKYLKQYARPENVNLVTTKVNIEIWRIYLKLLEQGILNCKNSRLQRQL